MFPVSPLLSLGEEGRGRENIGSHHQSHAFENAWLFWKAALLLAQQTVGHNSIACWQVREGELAILPLKLQVPMFFAQSQGNVIFKLLCAWAEGQTDRLTD